MALPQVTLNGNLTNDPELRYTQAGKPWITFRVACSERRKNDAGEWVDGNTTYIDVTSWLRAEALAAALAKGTQVMVNGQLKSRDYEDKDGQKRTAYDVNADTVAIVVKDPNRSGSYAQSTPAQVPSSWVPADAPLDEAEAPF